jgi:predicted HD superfamily hydrolase involved in NAD metabolism
MIDIKSLEAYLNENLSQERYNHSIRTSVKCVVDCASLGLDIEKGQIAGMVHDIAREKDDKTLLELTKRDGLKIYPWEKKHPAILHGRAGAQLLKEEFAIEDEELLEAVRWHTTGDPEMGDLAKVVYIADYSEPGRSHVDQQFLEDILQKSLDEQMIYILNHEWDYQKKKKRAFSRRSKKLYKKLSKRLRRK